MSTTPIDDGTREEDTKPKPLSSSQIDHFLYFGYVPFTPKDWQEQSWANVPIQPELQQVRDFDLMRLSGDAFEAGFAKGSRGLNVVPLSGGNDSRAILAALLNQYVSDEILTVTFGTPGAYDFEIPKILAKRAGVKHVAIDLTRVDFSSDILGATAEEFAEHPMWLFGPSVIRMVTSAIGTDATYWSGYLGGPVTGSHQPRHASESWEMAVRRHADRRPFGGAMDLVPEGYSTRTAFPLDEPSGFHAALTLDEKADLMLRQHAWLRREHAVAGYCQRFPFVEPEFLRVMFNAGHSWRAGQSLYLKMLHSRYPRLFELPHKDHLGLAPRAGGTQRLAARGVRRLRSALSRRFPRQVRFASPTVNYVDWDYAFRYRSDFTALAGAALQSLEQRGVLGTRKPTTWLRRHATGDSAVGLALSQLVSLEIYLSQSGGLGGKAS